MMKKVFVPFVVVVLLLSGGCGNSVDLDRAITTLRQVITHYDAGYASLFNELNNNIILTYRMNRFVLCEFRRI